MHGVCVSLLCTTACVCVHERIAIYSLRRAVFYHQFERYGIALFNGESEKKLLWRFLRTIRAKHIRICVRVQNAIHTQSYRIWTFFA